MPAKQANYHYKTQEINVDRKERYSIDPSSRKKHAQNKRHPYLNYSNQIPNSHKKDLEFYYDTSNPGKDSDNLDSHVHIG